MNLSQFTDNQNGEVETERTVWTGDEEKTGEVIPSVTPADPEEDSTGGKIADFVITQRRKHLDQVLKPVVKLDYGKIGRGKPKRANRKRTE